MLGSAGLLLKNNGLRKIVPLISEVARSMSQIFEALRRAETLQLANWRRDVGMAPVERRESDRNDMAARIRIYGHGQGLSPFFEENSILNASETGALLLMRVPVV